MMQHLINRDLNAKSSARSLTRWLAMTSLLALTLHVCPLMAETQSNSDKNTVAQVSFVETDDATCVVNDGKLVSLALKENVGPVDVWVDRWFMNVQTADHTKHRLSPDAAVADLGCSITGSGPQRWTIHSVIAVPE